MEKKTYLAPQIKVKFIVEEDSILAASAPNSITVSDDDVIDQGYVDAKGHHSYGVWDEDEDEELK